MGRFNPKALEAEAAQEHLEGNTQRTVAIAVLGLEMQDVGHDFPPQCRGHREAG